MKRTPEDDPMQRVISVDSYADVQDGKAAACQVFAEAHRSELVRLMTQAMRSLGYHSSAAQLESESDTPLQSPFIAQFRQLLLAGEWDAAVDLLPSLEIQPEKLPEARFLIYRQKYLELLDAGNKDAALACARSQLTPSARDQAALYRLLYLLMVRTADLRRRVGNGWDGATGTSRQRLVARLRPLISSMHLLQEHRLVTLLRQAQQLQLQRCLAHNEPPPAQQQLRGASVPLPDGSFLSLLEDSRPTLSGLPRHVRFTLRDHEDEVWFTAFSRRGRLLATAGKDATCFVYDATRWADPSWEPPARAAESTAGAAEAASDALPAPAPLLCLRGHTAPISFLSWSFDDQMLCTASNDATCRVWRIGDGSGECVVVFDKHTQPLQAAVWLPDNFIVSAAVDKLLYKWDLRGSVEWKIAGPRVADIAVSKDGQRMVTIDSDKRIVVYNLSHPRAREKEFEIIRYGPGHPDECFDDDRTLSADAEEDCASGASDNDSATSDGEALGADFTDGTPGVSPPSFLAGVPPSPLFTPQAVPAEALRFDELARSEAVFKVIRREHDPLTSLALSDDGNFLLVNMTRKEKHGYINLYDLRSRPFKLVQQYTDHLQQRFVIRSCFGGWRQQFVVTGSENNKIYIYHRDTGKRLLALAAHNHVANSVSWSPAHHQLFASSSDDSTVCIWTSFPARK